MTFKIYPLIFFLISTIIISCKQNNDKEIKTFESILGKEKSAALTELSILLDSFMVDKFKTESASESYKEYFKNFKNLENPFLKFPNSLNQKVDRIYSTTNLKNQIRSKPDSVWVINQQIKSLYNFWSGDKVISSDTTSININVLKNAHRIQEIDSIIDLAYNIYEPNQEGNFIKALESIKSKPKVVNQFLNITYATGQVDTHTLVKLLDNENVDFDNYFVKRIITLYLFY